jgi:hypothetical protein
MLTIRIQYPVLLYLLIGLLVSVVLERWFREEGELREYGCLGHFITISVWPFIVLYFVYVRIRIWRGR